MIRSLYCCLVLLSKETQETATLEPPQTRTKGNDRLKKRKEEENEEEVELHCVSAQCLVRERLKGCFSQLDCVDWRDGEVARGD